MRGLIASVILVFLTATAHAGKGGSDYSRFCGTPDPEENLREGAYRGTFIQQVKASRPVMSSEITQTYTTKGHFELIVGPLREKAKKVCDRFGTRLDGRLETTLEAVLPMQAAEAGVQRMGEGRLEKKEVCLSSFSATADITVSGNLYTKSRKSYSEQQSGGGTTLVEFLVEKASCDSASGKVLVDAMEQTATTLRSGGFKVTVPEQTWEMTRKADELQKKRKELKEELARPPSGQGASAYVQTREREAERLGDIADRIKEEDHALWDCLFEIWMTHTERFMAQWVEEMKAKLDSYGGQARNPPPPGKAKPGRENRNPSGSRGDQAALDDLIRTALTADKGLSLVGRDTCSIPMHQKLFEAIGNVLRWRLGLMAKGLAPMHDILSVLRTAELVGAVSPEFQEQILDSIRTQAKQQADITWNKYVAAKAAARGVKTNPAVREALAEALSAEMAANTIGLALDRAVKAASDM